MINFFKKIKENKVLNIIMKVINVAFVTIFVLFILMVCLQRFSGNKVSFFNYRMFTVISGSMKPRYDIGDVLISKEVAPEDIKIGDTISYLGTKGDFAGKVITHEVIGIKKDEAGQIVFRAQGLANLVEDPEVYANQLYGVVIHKSTILSSIYKIVGTTYGMLLCVIIPLFYIIGSEILSLLLEKEEKRHAKINN